MTWAPCTASLASVVMETRPPRSRQAWSTAGSGLKSGGQEEERVAHVVPVAHPRHLEPGELDAALPEREEVRHGLAGVFVVTQRVDHGHGSVPRQLHQGLVGEYAGGDAVNPAREVARHVGHGLALAHADLLGGEIHCSAPKLDHAHLESDPRAQRGLLEDEGHGAAPERADPLPRLHLGLELGGEAEQPSDVVPIEIANRQEVVHCLIDSRALSMMAQPSAISFSSTIRAGARRRVLSPAVRTRRPRSRQALTTSPTGVARSRPMRSPRPRTSFTAFGYLARRASRAWPSTLPMRAARSASLSSMSVANTVTPTAVARGLPPKVDP